MLPRLEPSPEDLWQEAQAYVQHQRGILALDDTILDKFYAQYIVIFDSWFSSLENLQLIARYGWTWLTRLKRNRWVNPDGTANRPLREVELSAKGTVVHLKH